MPDRKEREQESERELDEPSPQSNKKRPGIDRLLKE